MIKTVGKMIVAVCFLVAMLSRPVGAQAEPGDAQGESSQAALRVYADAASFQNNRAFSLAIDEWQKFLKSFPEDPLASKAWHFLGVAHIQSEEPDYSAAITAFSKALEDASLELRDRSLINLGWCHYTVASRGSDAQAQGLREAQRCFTDFLKEYPRGEFVDQALFYLGEIQYSQGNPSKAISYYQRLLETPNLKDSKLRPDAQYALGVAYEELKSPAKAGRAYREFLQEYGQHRLATEVSVRLADVLLGQQDAAGAEKILSGLEGGAEMGDYVLLRSGYALAQQGNTEAAQAKYLELLEKFPKSAHAAAAALSVGQSLFQQGKLDEAAKQFRRVLKARDAQSADAAHWLAVTLLRQDQPQAVRELVEEALQWAPEESKVTLQMDLADALYVLPGQLESAMTAYQEIARQHPQHALAPRAAYNAAFAALQSRKFEQARTWSEWFLQRFPQDPLRNDVAYVAAETLLLEGEHDAAITAYDRLLQADPENPSFPLWTLRLATAHYLAGQYPAAIELIRRHQKKYTQDDNQSAEALFVLGASLLYEEQLEDAIRQLAASHSASDSWGSADEVLLLLAEAYQRNKNNQAARQALERLLEKYPKSRLRAQAEYKLGQLSAGQGQFEEAIRSYQLIVTNPEAKRYHNFAQYGIAWCLMQQEKYAAALDQLAPLLEQRAQDPTLREAKLAQGVCLRKLQRTDEAIASLKDYLRGESQGLSLGNGLYELGLAYTDKQDWEAANRQFRRLLKDVPDYPAADDALYELAWNLQDNGQPEEAAPYFAQLARDFPESEFAAEAHYMQAQQLYDAERYPQAAEAYTRVIRSAADDALKEKALYKLGWSFFQQEQYPQAEAEFRRQGEAYPGGSLAVDALFMQAECAFKRDEFATALEGYRAARKQLEQASTTAASEQVQSLIYLHGAQCLREAQDWQQCQAWLEQMMDRFPDSSYRATARYELGFAKQKQGDLEAALQHYSEVANKYRNELGARARFMMGELHFAQRDFAKAIPEFQRVMYGFGGDKAPKEIKNWQVKSAFEAARCSEVLIENLRGEARDKIIKTASEFYDFIVQKHATHELAAQAETRLGELQKLR